MNTPAPVIPRHIYIHTETPDPDSGEYGLAISPDRLIAWAEEDHGVAVEMWCKQICEEKIDAINTWKDDRILELEDEWTSSEITIEDEDEDGDEHHYHQACETVVSKAEQKCRIAMEQMAEHRTAIERLVEQAREFKSAHTPPAKETHYAGFLITLAAAAAVAYVLLT